MLQLTKVSLYTYICMYINTPTLKQIKVQTLTLTYFSQSHTCSFRIKFFPVPFLFMFIVISSI